MAPLVQNAGDRVENVGVTWAGLIFKLKSGIMFPGALGWGL